MDTFIKHIEKILKTDDRLWSKDEEKKLLKNKLVELVSNDDEKLLGLLLDDSEVKKHFFKKIKDSNIFLKDRFLQFITMNEFLPDSFTAFENEIGLSDSNKLITQKDEISLIFPHKDCVLEGGQIKEEVGRNEIFYNTVLAPDEIDRIKEPKVLVNWKKFDKNGKHEVKEISKQDNLIIKGNNLLALYSLLPKYRGEIKLIYIDPPYNTGNDGFNYNDRFNHSAWLTFMQNRLEVAKELLADDGVIFVQCDDNEQAYLKVMLDEVFDKKFINTISVEMSPSSGVKRRHKDKMLIKNKEFILVYAKNNILLSPIYDEWESYDKHYSLFFDKEKIDTLSNQIKREFPKYSNVAIDKILYFQDIYKFIIKNSQNIFRTHDCSAWAEENRKEKDKIFDDKNKKIYKVFNPKDKEEFELLVKVKRDNGEVGYDRLEPLIWNVVENKICTLRGDLWLNFDKDMGNVSKEGGVKLKSGKKPERLLYDILRLATNRNDIILDFFAGAGTAGAVAHKMGRRYILVEQMDYIHDLPEARLINVIKGDQTGISEAVNWKGGGSFIYTELLEWNQKYINQLEKAKTQKEVLDIYKEIEKEQFYKYKYEPKKFNLKAFKELDLKEQKKALMDILDMNHLFVNRSSMDDTTFKVDDKDKKLTKEFYGEK